jgi:hypothetical protein
MNCEQVGCVPMGDDGLREGSFWCGYMYLLLGHVPSVRHEEYYIETVVERKKNFRHDLGCDECRGRGRNGRVSGQFDRDQHQRRRPIEFVYSLCEKEYESL